VIVRGKSGTFPLNVGGQYIALTEQAETQIPHPPHNSSSISTLDSLFLPSSEPINSFRESYFCLYLGSKLSGKTISRIIFDRVKFKFYVVS